MKKISTVQAFGNEIFKEQKLTIGVDLGDRWSFYCVLDEVGKIISYDKNGQFCELFISPQKPTTPIKSADQTAKTIDSNLLTEVINELVPESERGRGISGDFLNLTCLPSNDCAGSGSTWEKVSIYRNGGANGEHYATIIWRSAECASKTGQ